MATNFGFLESEWPQLFAEAAKAEALVYPDPRAACFYARRTLELTLQWLYKSDAALKFPYQQNLSALVHEPSFQKLAGLPIQTKARLIVELGNRAVHSSRAVPQQDALTAVRELFHICYWVAHTYAKGAKPAANVPFLPMLLPTTSAVPLETQKKLAEMETELSARDVKLTELLEEKENLQTGRLELDAELVRLRAEVAEAKRRNQVLPDTHDYSEAETRDAFVDLLLKEAGWSLDKREDREYEVSGMPNREGVGFVDYVLWGADGKPLAVVEAKRTKKSPQVGQQQAKLYADCLEHQFGRRPIIFYTNGYEHWMWDDMQYPPREMQGFLKRDELELLLQRRQTRLPLADVAIDKAIVERYYQQRAIRRVNENFEGKHQRKALLVMATGAGKTRTVIALCDVLMRANWVKRVLFLADRVALVKQARNAFSAHLPASAPVNLVTEKQEEGRVYVSTYPTMMGLIDEMKDGQRRFGVGHFDLIVVDEAHRSIYQKYGAIFDYFDSLLIGLTATPKNEIDRNTYGLFALERGVPTDEYSLDDAVWDKFLVPSKSVSVPLKFQREGIRYDQLSDEEKDEWDAIEWNDDGEIPDRVDAGAVNQWLFNKDTVDKVLKHLVERGQKVANGDQLGKTIIFAKNHAHAEFIAERFDDNYPHLKGNFARVIDFQVKYAQTLIDDFSKPDSAPHIAISVDMLDTGIDIPEIVNLAFFKLVRSKTKFWQMVGRGTRLRPDLFGPGLNKKFFYIFDYCQNLEFFSQNPDTTDGAAGESLGKKLFASRVELLAEIDKIVARQSSGDMDEAEKLLRADIAELLRVEVAGMNVDNFIVRPRRRLVERYAEAEAWKEIDVEKIGELIRDVAGLPSSVVDEDQEAKQFDLLILRLQLTLLRAEPGFEKMREQVCSIARLLEEKATIPMVASQLALIQEVQTDAFWEDVGVSALDEVRRKLRALVKFIEKTKRKLVYTDFDDALGEESVVALPAFSAGVDTERFRNKALQFLRKHEDDPAIHKLKWNEPMTPDDLLALEAIFLAEGGTTQDIEAVSKQGDGLGLFVRSLVGMNREAAKQAFHGFLDGKSYAANQIEFVNLIVDYLTRSGWIAPAQLYESPFTDLHPHGVDGLFDDPSTQALISILQAVRQNAVGVAS